MGGLGWRAWECGGTGAKWLRECHGCRSLLSWQSLRPLLLIPLDQALLHPRDASPTDPSNNTTPPLSTTAARYSPKPEFEGKFRVINVPNERALIVAFFDLVRSKRPHVLVTYNGDSFDWPYAAHRPPAPLAMRLWRCARLRQFPSACWLCRQ